MELKHKNRWANNSDERSRVIWDQSDRQKQTKVEDKNAAARLVSGTGNFDRGLSSATICTGSTFHQSLSITNWTSLCIAACRRKLRGTWSTVAHQFQKSPAVENYTLSQSTPPYCAAALPAEHVRAPLSLFGRWSYFVELFTGSSPRSNTEFWQF